MAGAAESLATKLPHLTQLTVCGVQPTAPMAPCSWRELTLYGRLQSLHDLIKLPLLGLDHVRVTHLELAPFSNGSVEALIHTLERYAPLLAAKLRSLSRVTLPCRFYRQVDGARVTSLLYSIVTLGGSLLTEFAITGLSVREVLQQSHMELLAMGLPHLTKLSLLHRNFALGAWPHIGALGLQALFLGGGGGVPFRAQHMGMLASSVIRPLRLVLQQCDIEAARMGLETLLAARHRGACLISLFQSDSEAAWEDVTGNKVLVCNMAEEEG